MSKRPENARPTKILSIDGGGTRGIIPATLLDCIHKETGKHPTELFNVLAGTSTGGILCIGLAHGLPPAALVDLYLTQSADIFYDNGWDDLRDGFGKNIGADYSHKRFKKILETTFGKTTLRDIHLKYKDKLYLMVSSFDINPETDDGKPVNFKPEVFNSGYIHDGGETLVDLALRTSAGPTYFPIYQKKYIDGGVAMNHPAMAAVAFALNAHTQGKGRYLYPDGNRKGLSKRADELHVLSLGCGTSNKNFIPASVVKDGDWGNIQWIKYLPDLLTEANVQASEYYVQQVLEPHQYKRIQLAFDSPEAPLLLHNQKKNMGMDVKKPELLNAMKEFATAYFHKHKRAILDFVMD
jgi:uncharacterized protein